MANPPPAQLTPEMLYWQEALRLSELTITEQNNTFVSIERKAILLVTLCIAAIAYLLAWATNPNKEIIVIVFILLTVFILMVAAWFGTFAWLIRNVKTPGATPEYLIWEGFNLNVEYMAKTLLKEYQDRLQHNEKVLNEKVRYLEKSMGWGVGGMVLVCLWVIGILGYELYALWHSTP